MYNLNDTITAISTASVTQGTVAKSIVRISGADAFTLLNEVFGIKVKGRGVTTQSIELTEGVNVDFAVYTFAAPNSYTAENLAELHFFAASCVVELVLEMLLKTARLAGPGEFTLRA
ncbi:MAG: tRNA uridine-5-carboxymethylaminomethyl(34) synthesis GTPase MnmE, partial [Planctomycetes bacterium]|nr:tRNA uridine-5-carboxymethylaminomethyl(34) synthesis GTPase MnmE [Planctomycetota bacterium]